MREHFTQEQVREEWGHSESWGLQIGHETKFQIIMKSKYMFAMAVFMWKSLALVWIFLLEPFDPQRESSRSKFGRNIHIWPAKASWVRCLETSLPFLIWRLGSAAREGSLARLRRLVILSYVSCLVCSPGDLMLWPWLAVVFKVVNCLG